MIDLSYIIQDMTTERTEERKNRFNGESVMLTPEEAKRHDEYYQKLLGDRLRRYRKDKENGEN